MDMVETLLEVVKYTLPALVVLASSNMIVRSFVQVDMTMTIRGEFEHNLSQQIYVSKQVWDTVKGVKEQEINMVNQLAKTLDPAAHAKELHGRIMDMIMKTENELPTDLALNMINDEVKVIMSHGHV
jgi:hypothetical protein